MSYVDRIIKAFGGVRPMAGKIGKPPSTVQSWKDRRSIPDEHKELVWEKAKIHKIQLSPTDFVPFSAGTSPPEAAA
ncbi:carph-isopro domain-containing protein [Pseudooceanicola sp. C21-150M6]|uniref:carph-isopro domain-containing protein n=1 Tax=Pseudooceanicola sp. C21-150M6 TaxID=3434355 RepID=UPI003D7FA8D0